MPPANIGPRSNAGLRRRYAAASIDLGGGRKVFAGQRDDPFFVDLGSIFDLVGLRPFNASTCCRSPAEAASTASRDYNVHSIALQVPKTRSRKAPNTDGTIGIYASASRPKTTIRRATARSTRTGRWVQVSRLGNPLVNEVDHPDRQEGLLERVGPEGRQAVPSRTTATPELDRARQPALPAAARRTRRRPRRPRRCAAHGRPEAELHRAEAGRPAPPQHRRSPRPPAEQARRARRATSRASRTAAASPTTSRTSRSVPSPAATGRSSGALGLCNLPPNNIVGDGVDANEQAFLPHFPYAAAPNQGYAHTGHS